jgi:hypothetical protein
LFVIQICSQWLCTIQTSVICLANESGLGDKRTDCNTIEASGDECNRFPVYIHSIENNGVNDIEIANLNVKRDGDDMSAKTINTQTLLAGESIRLVEERIVGSTDFCEKERIVTKTIVEAEEPKSCEDSATYTFGAPPTPPSPTLFPTRFSYQLDTFGFEEDRLTNFTDCSSRDVCDADSLCGFSGYAADAEFGAEDWIEATRGTKADCNVPGFDYYLLEGPYCPPGSRCSGRCHIELICSYDE